MIRKNNFGKNYDIKLQDTKTKLLNYIQHIFCVLGKLILLNTRVQNKYYNDIKNSSIQRTNT